MLPFKTFNKSLEDNCCARVLFVQTIFVMSIHNWSNHDYSKVFRSGKTDLNHFHN